MELEELSGLVEPRTLKIPVKGVTYTVNEVDGATWLLIQKILKTGDQGERSNEDVYRIALGDVFDQIAANVSGSELDLAGTTALFWQSGNEELAAAYWRSGGKAPTPEESTGTSTGAAPSTSTPGSSSSTSTPKKSPAKSRPKKQA